VGLDWAHARTAELGRRVWDGLRGIAGVTVTTPCERMAGLVCFTAEGIAPKEMAARLYERNLTIRYVETKPCPNVARVAAAWWNTEEEVDRLITAVAAEAGSARPPDQSWRESDAAGRGAAR